MLNIAVTILSIVFFNTFISLIGQAAITSVLYGLTFKYILPNDTHKKQRTLKAEIIKGRSELSNTSAQDDFSKWAKIRRRVDKQVAELEGLNNSLASHRQSFNRIIKAILFISTTGLQWYFTTRHSKAAIVYLPQDWFGPLTWFLGLPFAPKGALSCGIFIMLVKRVMGIVTRIGKDVIEGVRGDGSQTQPVAVPVPASTAKAQPVSSQKKKE